VTKEQEWNEYSTGGSAKASSSPSDRPSSKRPIRTDVDDKGNAADGHAPNGGGGPRRSGGKMTVNLKRAETAGETNDDEAEKRLGPMSSDFEEWMKMATDNVSIRFSAVWLNCSFL